MSEMAVFRSEVECLRAENARLMARVAELEAKPMVEKKRKPDAVPMRWTWDDNNPTAMIICIVMWMIVIGSIVAVVLYFIGTGSLPSITVPMLRGLLVFAIAAIAWCLAFVRRVPR